MKNLTFSDKIVLYWDYNREVISGAVYGIFVDGKKIAETDKTHITLENLTPDTEYKIKICLENAVIFDGAIKTGVSKHFIDVTKPPYNALGDGKTLNTKAIQSAIDDCKENDAVYFPAGAFLSGSLFLHSDMEIYLDENATLQGTDTVEDYSPKINSRFEGIEMQCYSALLNMGTLDNKGGANCKNIIIRGKGKIFGGGKCLADNVIALERVLQKDYIESLGEKVKECENDRTIPGRPRPRLINISNCQNIVLEGLTLGNGACWNIHFIYSNNIVTANCSIISTEVWNGDGIDPDSSTDCDIFNIDFLTGDDCIAVKSGKNPEGNIINRPCERINIFDCRCKIGHGLAIGSEMSGGVNDVHIWDCDVKGVFCLKATQKRGGYIKNIQVDRSSAAQILICAVTYNDDGEDSGKIPVFENFEFSDLILSGICPIYGGGYYQGEPISISGFDDGAHAVNNVSIKNIKLPTPLNGESHNFVISKVKNLTMQNINCD